MKDNKILYLGLDLPDNLKGQQVIHYPVIKIVPKKKEDPDITTAFQEIYKFTHIIFTSKSAVKIFLELLPQFNWNISELSHVHILAVGRSTAACALKLGLHVNTTSENESSEGIVSELSKIHYDKSFVLWPHSSLSRTVITDFLKANQVHYCECILYDTIPQKPFPIPELSQIDEIVFTSPSTVDAFLNIYGSAPNDKLLTAIGPITKAYLSKKSEVRNQKSE